MSSIPETIEALSQVCTQAESILIGPVSADRLVTFHVFIFMFFWGHVPQEVVMQCMAAAMRRMLFSQRLNS